VAAKCSPFSPCRQFAPQRRVVNSCQLAWRGPGMMTFSPRQHLST
jgi:hypothetical protein